MYADDAVLMITSPNILSLMTDIQSDVLKIFYWLEDNKLQMNIEKTNYIIFDKHKKYTEILPEIKIINNKINHFTQFKYLGLIKDSKVWINTKI